MTQLPSEVSSYLQQIELVPQRIVWIEVTPRGHIASWGGDVDLIAPRHLSVGDLVEQEIFALTGMLPLTTRIVIPRIEMLPGVFVHFHGVPREDDSGWLLLIDASDEFESRRREQQEAYDDALTSRRRRT